MIISDEALAVITIRQEAEAEDYKGKVAVGEVIRTRTRTGYQSDGTVRGTILKPWQFSGWNQDGADRLRAIIMSLAMYPEAIVNKECIDAWHESIGTDFTKKANLYFNPRLANPPWANHPRVVFVERIGGHDFYREV